MISAVNVTSAKNKDLKNVKSARFFKKMPTDENEKNVLNYLQKIQQYKIDKKDGSKKKKSYQNLTNLISLTNNNISGTSHASGRVLKTTNSVANLTSPTRNLIATCNMDSKDKENNSIRKCKNLKLTSSIQFPKILIKSISQTTVNKKTDQKTLKLLEKIGGNDKKRIKKRSSCLLLNSNQLKISNFRLGKKLGNGRFGSVYMAEHKETGIIVALKVLNKAKISQAQMQDQIKMQIKLQSFMNHPNILKLFGYFHDSKNIYLVLEYCSTCLFKDFRKKEKLTEAQTAYYTKQAISGLKYMHNEYIIHRDIKPQNILVEFGVLKLSDFGWSIYSPMYKRQTFCGTVDYVPPEIIQGASYDERVDIWALGILLYELCSGKAPFQNRDENITYEKIVRSQCKFPQHFSKQLVCLIKKILDKNPKKRPDLQQIENHEWFQQYKTAGRYISKPIWNAWNNL